ncbi:hypothetical protein BD324DRAFT_613501 [Kockovaella imperatae]|uniref:ATPase inhibitor, mitochondrial n=1 Tax=Kockovaella imperatae TaxID=4999 RepID=A0A1Y1UT30_9TREE|nr:hypothetical protein BD324DRAFT_613501 [Kockovaella imperatae]ORX41173.1 hypothetical protein BD324DRAFT_613501 [Kockovaella imperatae]
MSAIRAFRSARITSLRAPTVMFSTRGYADSTRPEGQTASSKGFSQREQAEEGQYIRKKEQEKLKEAQDKLKLAQDEVDKAQDAVNKSKSK